MKKTRYTVITGTGSCIPPIVMKNEEFLFIPGSKTEKRKFYRPDGQRVQYSDAARKGQIKPTSDIVETLEKITGIRERRWAPLDSVASDLCTRAAANALASSGTDPESIDLVIVAHNFGDRRGKGAILDIVPSMASRLKNRLKITGPKPIAFDVIVSPEHLGVLKEFRFGRNSGEQTFLVGEGLKARSRDIDALVQEVQQGRESRSLEAGRASQIVVSHLDQGGSGVECIAGKVKRNLAINAGAIAYDLVFGCPGWIQAMVDADRYLSAGLFKKALIIGGETCARFAEDTDMDCMIFADGAGAVICEAIDSEEPTGILSYATRSDAEKLDLLALGPPYCPEYNGDAVFIDMKGHDVFKYGVRYVAATVQESLDRAGIDKKQVHKFLLHQANEKMDVAIFNRLNGNDNDDRTSKMPMTISWLGNSSVATIPTMLDLILREDSRLEGHQIHPGDNLVFASVGAGMNINSLVYKMNDLHHISDKST